jgi:hypothetical protein
MIHETAHEIPTPESESETLDLILDAADIGAAIALAFICKKKHLHCISNAQILRATKCKIIEVE